MLCGLFQNQKPQSYRTTLRYPACVSLMKNPEKDVESFGGNNMSVSTLKSWS